MKIDKDKIRANKLKEYLLKVIDSISKSKVININALSKEVGSYSLDKIPTESEVSRFITGVEIHRDTFSLVSKRNFSYNEIDNLLNIGFFEIFERTIFENSRKHILPDIDGIQSIKCLNPGTMRNAEKGTADFYIQIQIEYRVGGVYETN